MALKQINLFDFVDEPVKNTVPIPAVSTGPAVLNEDPVEFEIARETPAEPSVLTGIKKNTRGRKKLSEAALGADLIEVPEDDILFQKKYYAIGLVAEMFKVNISLIRFWEKEFDILKPKKNGKGDRHFRPEDVKNLKMIYHLLREKKYTIEGAKEFLKNNRKADENFAVIEDLKKTKLFLTDLKLSL